MREIARLIATGCIFLAWLQNIILLPTQQKAVVLKWESAFLFVIFHTCVDGWLLTAQQSSVSSNDNHWLKQPSAPNFTPFVLTKFSSLHRQLNLLSGLDVTKATLSALRHSLLERKNLAKKAA